MITFSFIQCRSEGEVSRVPIGYQNHIIFLGDTFEEITDKIGPLKIDVNAKNTDNLKGYLKIPDQIVVDEFQINPLLFLKLNEDRLVKFQAIYMVDNVHTRVDYQKLLLELSKNELTIINSLLRLKNMSMVNSKEKWLRELEIDTVAGVFPKIKYTVQVISSNN